MSSTDLQDIISIDVRRALAEDIGSGDITAELIPPSRAATATVLSREDATLCGVGWFNEVFQQLDPSILIEWHAGDGDAIHASQDLCTLNGNARALLSGERTALNFLQTLSATATLAARYAEAVIGSNATVLDTRKTIPGLRRAQKYAVTCGGCKNHRLGLYDAYLIKENHIAAAGSISAAVDSARQKRPDSAVEVEVENLDELTEAIASGADSILLDNFSLQELQQAIAINNGKVKLEASGGVSLETIAAIAATGVDYISTGELTKNIRAIDLSMRFE